TTTREALGPTPPGPLAVQTVEFGAGALPLLTQSGQLYVCSYVPILAGENPWVPGFVYNLAGVSLPDKKIVAQRRFYDSMIQSMAQWFINDYAPKRIKDPDSVSFRDALTKIAGDKIPQNDHGP